MSGTAGAARSLYVHIPFCERKCHYCDFVSVAGTRGEAEYVKALATEITRLGAAAGDTALDTVFFGGGTPGLLEPKNLAMLLRTITTAFVVEPDAEITLEANPSSTSESRASAWLAAGFNRASLGVQSFDPAILGFLGRVHDGARAAGAVAEVRAAGFGNVNCDLIYAVPGLSDALWTRTLDRAIGLGPDHISCYELTVEEGTPLHRQVARGEVRPADAEVALRQHWITVDRLAAAGYAQYEVSNFARPGRESRHNLTYWRNQPYLAAGVGAHGHVEPVLAARLGLSGDETATAVRYWHTRSVREFVASMEAGALPVAGSEPVSPAARLEETVMLGLRLAEGLADPGFDGAELERLAGAGLVIADSGRIRATRRGQEVLNEVAARLVLALPEAIAT